MPRKPKTTPKNQVETPVETETEGQVETPTEDSPRMARLRRSVENREGSETPHLQSR
jgi:hypothetical protein